MEAWEIGTVDAVAVPVMPCPTAPSPTAKQGAAPSPQPLMRVNQRNAASFKLRRSTASGRFIQGGKQA